MNKRKVAKQFAILSEKIDPWEFRDVYSSITECTECVLSDLNTDPCVIWNAVDDLLEMVERDDPIHDDLECLQYDVGEIVSAFLEAKGEKPFVIIA